jgi:4'-phosphopantetheinyl transferase
MSRMTSVSSQAPDVPDDRFSVMLAHFAFREPETQRPRSILCRVLDGRGLDEVCPSDAMILTQEERLHYHSTLKNPQAHALAVRTRAELRRMLARETGVPPQKVSILCDGHGKPRCADPGATDLDFSASRADKCAIIALGEGAGVGVDVEQVLDQDPSDENLEMLFTVDEFRDWAALATPARRLAFTQAWTIKEAALKATGMGLDGDAHEIPVRFDESGNVWPVLPSTRWIFERIYFCPRYAASFIALMPESEAPLHSLAA